MADTIDITLPIDADLVKGPMSPVRREAAGLLLSELLKGSGASSALANAIAALKQEARANGLTDEDIDAELAAWRAEART